MPLARAMARPASSGLHRLAAPAESYSPGAAPREAVVVAGGWVGHDGGLALDRLAGAGLEVGQDQFLLDGFVILLGPAAQPVQADDPGHEDGLQRAVLAGLDRRHTEGCGAVEFGDEVWAFAGAVEAVGNQRPERDALGAGQGGGGRDDAVSDLPAGAEVLTGHRGRGVPGLPNTGVVRKQRPAVVGRDHRLRHRGQRLVAVPRRRQGGDVIPRRPTLRTADKKVTAAGRPDAVGV